MKKRFFAGFGIGVILSIMGYTSIPLYISIVFVLGWRSYLVFPPLAGLLAWGMIQFFADKQKTLEEVIEEKIKSERRRKKFLSFFNKSKSVAFIFSAIVIGPYLTPLIVRACVKREDRAILYSVLLNFFSTVIWLFLYFGGWEAIKAIFGI